MSTSLPRDLLAWNNCAVILARNALAGERVKRIVANMLGEQGRAATRWNVTTPERAALSLAGLDHMIMFVEYGWWIGHRAPAVAYVRSMLARIAVDPRSAIYPIFDAPV